MEAGTPRAHAKPRLRLYGCLSKCTSFSLSLSSLLPSFSLAACFLPSPFARPPTHTPAADPNPTEGLSDPASQPASQPASHPAC